MKCVNHQVTLFVLFISQSICYALGYAPIINHSLVKLKPTTTIIPRLISSSRFSLMNDEHHSEIEPIDLMHSDDSGSNIVISTSMAIGSFIMMSSIIVTDPTVANALVDSVANPPFIDPAVASAIIAYGHYLSLILMVASVLTERILIKADMTVKDEEKVIIADSIYGIAGVLGLVTGYYRVTEYGKGWEFYSHEPLFWFKLCLASIFASSSFFPTIQIIKRAIARQKEADLKPWSDKLIRRLTSIINAELLALAAIPLSATLMSRGVGYAEWFPWQLGAAAVTTTLVGFGYKYSKEALTWQEE